jgi:hypothetical protein
MSFLRAVLFTCGSVVTFGVPACSSDAPSAEPVAASPQEATANANPPSALLPARWAEVVADRAIVVVAGTNNASDAEAAFRDHVGDDAGHPLHHWQAVEAAMAILDVTKRSVDTIYAFGYGPAPEERPYFYRVLDGRTLKVTFLGTSSVSPGKHPTLTSFGTGQAEEDAKNLKAEIETKLRNRKVLCIGHSWGGAVLDYGKLRGILDMPAISIGAPVKLFSNPIEDTRLRDDGDYPADGLYVARRPDDPVRGEDPIAIAVALVRGELTNHDYMLAWHGPTKRPGGVWGLSGDGMLCSAKHGGSCPLR